MHRSNWIKPEEAKVAIDRGTGRGIKIAVIDSGIDLSHPDLHHLRLVDDIAFEENYERKVERITGGGVDTYGHGTAVAAIILRAAPEAQLGSFRVLDSQLGSKSAIVAEAARTAIERGYHILNCSFGCSAESQSADPDSLARWAKRTRDFKGWVDSAYQRGVHVVSACNNNDFRRLEWPSYFPSVVAVNMAKTEKYELFFRWESSSGNDSIHLVEFAARGVDLELPWRNHWVLTGRTGSSFAAPHAAGLLARLLSVHPNLKPLVAKSLLQEVAETWNPDLAASNG